MFTLQILNETPPPNCYCQMSLKHQWWVKELPYEIFTPARQNEKEVKEVNQNEVVIINEAKTTTKKKTKVFETTTAKMPEEKKFLAGEGDEEVLRCVCPGNVTSKVDVNTVRRKRRTLVWNDYLIEALPEMKLLANKYKIFCYNGEQIQQVRPTKNLEDKMIVYNDILEEILQSNIILNENNFV